MIILIITTLAFLSCTSNDVPLIKDGSYDQANSFECSTRSDTASNDNSDDKEKASGEIIDWEVGGAEDIIANEESFSKRRKGS